MILWKFKENICDTCLRGNMLYLHGSMKKKGKFMKKLLSEMTLEELWELFPIFLTAPNDKRSVYYSEMEQFLTALLSDYQITRISHIGSTAVNGFAEKVYHLHVRYAGDHDELYFRDYLNEHTRIAKEYEQLKLNLWKKFEHDRDGYTNAKSEFVEKWTSEAKKMYLNRY